MTNKIYFIIFLLLLPIVAKAQLGKELIPNGGFEEYAKTTGSPSEEDEGDEEEEEDPDNFDPYQKPLYWYFNAQLGYSRVKDAHGGEFAVKVYPNGHSFYSRDMDFNTNNISINADGEYRMTYWYKGKAKNPNIVVTVDWYKDNKNIKTEKRDREKVTSFSDEWQQKTLTFKAPPGINKAGIAFYLEYDSKSASSDGYILIDDVSFVQTKEGTTAATLDPPSNVTAQPQQREMELSWNAVPGTGISYEILLNKKLVGTTTGTSYIVEKLMPGTFYSFSVRSVKGTDTSAPSADLVKRTLQMTMETDNEGRIPYLYNIRETGTCPRTLRLYYNDLAVPDARISYRIDGVTITPQDGSITFPTKGRHILQVEIEETPDHKWEIEYKLNVD